MTTNLSSTSTTSTTTATSTTSTTSTSPTTFSKATTTSTTTTTTRTTTATSTRITETYTTTMVVSTSLTTITATSTTTCSSLTTSLTSKTTTYSTTRRTSATSISSTTATTPPQYGLPPPTEPNYAGSDPPSVTGPTTENPVTPVLMMMDASFNFSITSSELCFHEVANPMGERMGSYSFVSPEGEVVEVHYTAGTDGYVILNKEELPQELPFSVCSPSPPDVQLIPPPTTCSPNCLLVLPWQQCPLGCSSHNLPPPCCRPSCPAKCARNVGGPEACPQTTALRECEMVPGCCPEPYDLVFGAGADFGRL